MARSNAPAADLGSDAVHGIPDKLLPFAVPIADVKPRDVNPRRGDVVALARALEMYGQRRLAVVNERTGMTEAGSHMWTAAVELGWTHLAVLYVDDDPETDVGFTLADNRVAALGTIDDEVEAMLLRELADAGRSDLLDAAGYTDEDVEDAIADLLDAEAEAVGNVGEFAPTPGERAEGFAASEVRSIVLPYAIAEYAAVVRRLAVLRGRYGIDNNADAVARLLDETVGDSAE